MGKPSKSILARLKDFCCQIDLMLEDHEYDLGLVDEMFAIIAGVTLFVSIDTWVINYPRILLSIVISVFLTSSLMVVAINQKRFHARLIIYVVSLVASYLGIEWILDVSARDLIPEMTKLSALPVGLVIWAFFREISIAILNYIGK